MDCVPALRVRARPPDERAVQLGDEYGAALSRAERSRLSPHPLDRGVVLLLLLCHGGEYRCLGLGADRANGPYRRRARCVQPPSAGLARGIRWPGSGTFGTQVLGRDEAHVIDEEVRAGPVDDEREAAVRSPDFDDVVCVLGVP